MATARRRGDDLEAAIHAAVLDELTAHSYSGLTFEGVAAAASTSKTVLYRRWSTKAAMILSAVTHTHARRLETPDTGSLVGDLTALMESGRRLFGERTRQTMLGVLGDIDATAVAELREWIFARSAEILDPIIARARERGELGSKPLSPRVASLPLDLLRHEILLRRQLRDTDIAELIDQCVVPLYTTMSAADGSSDVD